MTLKVLELFGGIGACTAALKRLGIDIEVVDYVEIDKHAVASYNAINGTDFKPQDVTKWDKDIKVDFVLHGSPCQDFSLAGLQKGGDEGSGTRSSLMYETLRIVKKLKPKYVVWENVANLLSQNHFHNFANYINAMGELGYASAYKVLNAKDYGIPQNRERVFTVSVLNGATVDLFGSELDFKWPSPFELKLRLKDMLEDDVDERYFLTQKQIDMFIANDKKQRENGNGFRFEVSDGGATPQVLQQEPDGEWMITSSVHTHRKPVMSPDGVLATLTAHLSHHGHFDPVVDTLGNYSPSEHNATRVIGTVGVSPTVMDNHGSVTAIAIKNATEKGYLLAEEGDGIDISSRMEAHRGTVQKGMTQTLTTAGGVERGVIVKGNKNDNNTELHSMVRRRKIRIANESMEHRNDNRNIDGGKNLDDLSRSDWGGKMDDLRIRKLTPRECWRLMGRTDEDFEKAEKVNSDSQLYKQAGNSIVVDVLVYLFDEIFKQYPAERNENG